MAHLSFLRNIMDKYKVKYENAVTLKQTKVYGVVPFRNEIA